jgi:hypothetical protein
MLVSPTPSPTHPLDKTWQEVDLFSWPGSAAGFEDRSHSALDKTKWVYKKGTWATTATAASHGPAVGATHKEVGGSNAAATALANRANAWKNVKFCFKDFAWEKIQQTPPVGKTVPGFFALVRKDTVGGACKKVTQWGAHQTAFQCSSCDCVVFVKNTGIKGAVGSTVLPKYTKTTSDMTPWVGAMSQWDTTTTNAANHVTWDPKKAQGFKALNLKRQAPASSSTVLTNAQKAWNAGLSSFCPIAAFRYAKVTDFSTTKASKAQGVGAKKGEFVPYAGSGVLTAKAVPPTKFPHLFPTTHELVGGQKVGSNTFTLTTNNCNSKIRSLSLAYVFSRQMGWFKNR